MKGRGRKSKGATCFFFQAEDGIRDGRVTGVQTCALPISRSGRPASGCRTFGSADFIRFPSPAARMMTDRGEVTPDFELAMSHPLSKHRSAESSDRSVGCKGLCRGLLEPWMAEESLQGSGERA